MHCLGRWCHCDVRTHPPSPPSHPPLSHAPVSGAAPVNGLAAADRPLEGPAGQA